jgi:hypothetical protein
MPSLPPEAVRRLRVPGYLVMTALGALPLIELGAAMWPLQLGQTSWRFGVFGVAAGTMVTSLLALVSILAIAVLSGDRKVIWVVYGLCALAATICLLGGGIYALDAMQMRSQVRPEVAHRYTIGWLLALMKLWVAGIIFIVLTISAFRATRGSRADVKVGRERGASPLVIGGAGGVRRPVGAAVGEGGAREV